MKIKTRIRGKRKEKVREGKNVKEEARGRRRKRIGGARGL